MKNKDIIQEISRVTTEIEEKYPELEKYLDEKPIGIPSEDPAMERKELEEYLEGLQKLMRDYDKSHKGSTDNNLK